MQIHNASNDGSQDGHERLILTFVRSLPLSPGPALPSIGDSVEYLFANRAKEGEEWSLGDEWTLPEEDIAPEEPLPSAIERALRKARRGAARCAFHAR